MAKAQTAAEAAKAAYEKERGAVLSPASKDAKRAESMLQCDLCSATLSAAELGLTPLEAYEAHGKEEHWLCPPCAKADDARKSKEQLGRRREVQRKLQNAVRCRCQRHCNADSRHCNAIVTPCVPLC